MHPVCLLTFVLLLGFLVPGNGRAEDGSRTIRLADAVGAAIVNATGVVQQKLTVEQKKGVVKEEQGTFDPLLTLSTSYDQSDTPYDAYYREYYNKPFEKQQTFSSSISLQQILPEGISFGPRVSLERTRDNLIYLTDNTSVLEFSVTAPLLKGAGRGSTGAALTAASIDLEAAGLDLVQTAAESTRQAAKSFWAALAAKYQLHIFQETEKDSKALLENARILVEKNEMPAIQLDTLTADVDARTAERISQEQKLDAAKYQLVLDMGVEAIAMVDAFRVDGVFPHVDMSVAPAEELLKFAMLNRQDLEAERRREKYYAVLVGKYSNELLPNVSLSGTVGYQGLSEDESESGFFDSIQDDTSGVNYTIGLGLTYPLGNNAAKGKLMQYQVMMRKQHITVLSTSRNIYAEVLSQRAGFLSAARQLKHQQDAVKHYRAALEKKRVGLLHGMVTLTDLLDMRDTYRDSRISLVSTYNLYADALVDLRLACGYLIAKEGSLIQVDPKALLTPPLSPLPGLSRERTGVEKNKTGNND